MSHGLVCLHCRHYIVPISEESCSCEEPIPSWDAHTPAEAPIKIGIQGEAAKQYLKGYQHGLVLMARKGRLP